jgi:hypothetical protein
MLLYSHKKSTRYFFDCAYILETHILISDVCSIYVEVLWSWGSIFVWYVDSFTHVEAFWIWKSGFWSALCLHLCVHMRSDNKVCKLTTMCLPWQQWTETSVWFDDVGISVFHSCVVDQWQSLPQWRLLSECVLVCRRENVRAWIRALSVRKFLASKK